MWRKLRALGPEPKRELGEAVTETPPLPGQPVGGVRSDSLRIWMQADDGLLMQPGGLGGDGADLLIHNLEDRWGPAPPPLHHQAWLSAAELGRMQTQVVDEGLCHE